MSFPALILLASTAWAGPRMIPEQDTELSGRTAPTFELPLLDGGSFDLSEQRGEPVVLNFWASWCGPCRRELPALEKFAQKHPDVHFLAVNVDRDPADARRFLVRTPFDLPIALDSNAKVMGQYLVASMPTTVVIDSHGTVKLVKVGYNPTQGFEEIEKALEGMER